MRRATGRLADHWLVFPAMALLVLCIVWGTTVYLVGVERQNAEHKAEGSTLELADTYEAQMLRNLREIDHTLKVVQYASRRAQGADVLAELRRAALLPSPLLFSLAIAEPAVQAMPSADALQIRARRDGGDWKLDFARRLEDRPGYPARTVVLTVDAAYFVSSYESAKLGARGVLGLAGSDDGVFRVRRTGDTVAWAGTAELARRSAAVAPGSIVRARNEWDGEERFLAVRPLYDFPLTLLVGLSEAEQLEGAQARGWSYVRWAGVASAVLVLFIGALGGASWQLTRVRRREAQARAAHAERVQYLAYHDTLSGLPNRAFFNRTLEQAIAEARRTGRHLAVMFLDLDRFKQINDTLGHGAGDALLKEVAARLCACLRQSDTVARLGGDEFVVLLPHLEDERYISTVAQKILAAIADPFHLSGQSLFVTTSVGIAVFPRDGTDEQTLMKCADSAMYHAKGEGKNNCQFYSSKLQESSRKRLAIESGLRLALEQGQFELRYQPKVDLAAGRITGAEALLRWRSPEHGLVPPAEFIPIAEDTGLIGPIGLWALEAACAQNMAWRAQGFPPLCIAINMSARQFAEGKLADEVIAILGRTGMDPRDVELEITESLLMTNLERSLRTLGRLSAAGFRLAIDDFGTGYSSLSHLKRFPLTTLKIDRSFIAELPHDADGRVITEAIIGLGKALKLMVVAEGVESAEQASYLRRQGCDEYQGFFFSRPLEADAFAALLARGAPHAQQERTTAG